jgi:hypothetical protein
MNALLSELRSLTDGQFTVLAMGWKNICGLLLAAIG